MSLEPRIGAETSNYLEPAARAVRTLRDTLHERALDDQLPLVETFSSSLLREIPQIANLDFADQNGNFVLIRRRKGSMLSLSTTHPGRTVSRGSREQERRPDLHDRSKPQ